MKKSLALILSVLMVLALMPMAHAEPIEIDYWSVFTGADGATMQGMVDAFNASQDEVHVTHTPMTADDLYQKIPMFLLFNAIVSRRSLILLKIWEPKKA